MSGNSNFLFKFKRPKHLQNWKFRESKQKQSKHVRFESNSIFFNACMAGDKTEVNRLIRNGFDINTTNYSGSTALHMLTRKNKFEMVQYLVQNGCDINRRNDEGWTALHLAVDCGHYTLVKFMVKNQANLAALNYYGDLPLDMANNKEIKEYLSHEMQKRDIDAEKVHNDEAEEMFKIGNDASFASKTHPDNGETLLHIAAARGYMKVINLLLEQGADIEKRDNDGWTPLHAAVYGQHTNAIQILFENTEDINCRTHNNESIYDIAPNKLHHFLKKLQRKRELQILMTAD